jgi:hypothetical protein
MKRTHWLPMIGCALLACGGDAPASRAGSVVRDSAGVRIVESAAPSWAEGEGWRLAETPSLEIRGDGDDADVMPLDPASVFRLGESIVVADGMSVGHDALLIYDGAGRFVRRIGRSGNGPCEFNQLWWAQPYRGDSIAAYDYADHAVTIVTADGGCGREVRLPNWQPTSTVRFASFSEHADGAFADGSFLSQPGGYLDVSSGTGPVWWRHSFLRVTPDGAAYDSLGLFEIGRAHWPGGEEYDQYHYGAFTSRAVTPDGFYFGTAEDFEIRRYDADGTLRAIVRRAFEPEPVTEADRAAFIDAYVERTRAAGRDHGGDAAAERARLRLQDEAFAPVKPAYSTFLVDAEGNLWVQTYRTYLAEWLGTVDEPVEWSVFDPGGRWLGVVSMPGRFEAKSIGAAEVLGLWTDEDGIKHVRGYSLLWP